MRQNWYIGLGLGLGAATLLTLAYVVRSGALRRDLSGITYGGKKLTSNQLAKIAVIDRGSTWEYFHESEPDTFDDMTEREIAAYGRAGERQFERVHKLLDPNGDLY